VVITQLTPDQRGIVERIGLLDRRGDYFGASYGGGWITIPNRRGATRRVIDLQGRAFPEDPRKPRWLTRPGHVRFLFNDDALRSSRVILAEGLTDALTLLAAGYRDSGGVYGQGGFKADWIPRFARCETIYVAFDRDATAKAVQVASLFGARGRVVLLPADLGPKGDLNALRIQLGSAGRFRQVLDQLLKQAPLPIEVAIATVEVQPLTTLRARITPLLWQIANWPDPIVRDHLTRLLAERCGLTLEVVQRATRDAAREPADEGTSQQSGENHAN
jgi:DNA primase